MDKIGKIFSVIFIISLIYAGIVITQTPASEGISVLVGEYAALPLADDCRVYAEYLRMNEDDYHDIQDIANDTQSFAQCANCTTRVSLIIYTVFDKGAINKHIDLSEGGVGIFYNPKDKKEYLIFFERVVLEIKENKKQTVAVFLRIKQL